MSIEMCENCGTQWDTDFNTGEYLMDSAGNYHPICPECDDNLFDEDGKLDFKTDDFYKLLRNSNAEQLYNDAQKRADNYVKNQRRNRNEQL